MPRIPLTAPLSVIFEEGEEEQVEQWIDDFDKNKKRAKSKVKRKAKSAIVALHREEYEELKVHFLENPSPPKKTKIEGGKLDVSRS